MKNIRGAQIKHTQNSRHHVDKKQLALPFLQYICERPKWHHKISRKQD